MHRFALGAARATECARGEDKFGSMVDALFNKQDSLGLKSWVSYGVDAGLRDTAAFARCMSSSASISSVEAGRSLGRRMEVNGTPTIIVNGWRFQAPPYDSLAAVVARFGAAVTRGRELAQPKSKTNGSPH
jgi:protein-disulfide isomerase